MKLRQLLENLTPKQTRTLYLKLLSQRSKESQRFLREGEETSEEATQQKSKSSSIIKITDPDGGTTQKFAVTAAQREELISYLSTAQIKSRETTGEDGELTIEEYEERVAESAGYEDIKAEILDALKSEVVNLEIGEASNKGALLSAFLDGEDWLQVVKEQIVEAFKLIIMDKGIDKLVPALFSMKEVPPAGPDPVIIPTPPILQPLFSIEHQGRGKTMGRGEVLLALSYENSRGDGGGEYDVTLNGTPYHVKDLSGKASKDGEGLTGVDDSVPLGKTDAWQKDAGPFGLLKNAGANTSSLTLDNMVSAMPEVLKQYAAGEASGDGFVKDFPAEPGGVDKLNLVDVGTHFQQSLDLVVATSDTFKGEKGPAGGIIFGGGGKLYLAGPEAFHFDRTSQSALRVTPKAGKIPGGMGKNLTDTLAYKAVINYKEMQKAKADAIQYYADLTAELNAMPNLGNATGPEIVEYMYSSGLFPDVPKASKGKTTMQPPRFGRGKKLYPGFHNLIQSVLKAKGHDYTMSSIGKLITKNTWDPEVLKQVQALAPETEGGEGDTVSPQAVQSLVSKEAELATTEEAFIRNAVREILLTEELNKSDKKEIERIAKKQAAKIVAAELDKALGASFFGTKGKVNKFVSDEVSKRFKAGRRDPDFADTVETICKEILKKFHRDMALKYPQMVDRIKIR